MATEFEHIAHLLRAFALAGGQPEPSVTVVGPGDDAAVLRVDGELVITTDALVEDVDFGVFSPWEAVGHKAVAVNVSDLAAMGAKPLAMVWSVCAPVTLATQAWTSLAQGAAAACAQWGLPCVGGDLSRTAGPLVLSVTALGTVASGCAVRRSGAQAGDGIYVSGTLGGAAAGLDWLKSVTQRPASLDALLALCGPQAQLAHAVRQQVAPTPRLELGRALVGVASAMVDVSDGLMQDLAHLLMASGVGARLNGVLPLHPAAQAHPHGAGWALAGGEDFELLFTARDPQAVKAVARACGVAVTRLGEVGSQGGLEFQGTRLETPDVERLHQGLLPARIGAAPWLGWRHFE